MATIGYDVTTTTTVEAMPGIALITKGIYTIPVNNTALFADGFNYVNPVNAPTTYLMK